MQTGGSRKRSQGLTWGGYGRLGWTRQLLQFYSIKRRLENADVSVGTLVDEVLHNAHANVAQAMTVFAHFDQHAVLHATHILDEMDTGYVTVETCEESDEKAGREEFGGGYCRDDGASVRRPGTGK